MHELIKKRRSIRKFSDKEVEDEKLKQILTAAMVAPSARNIRPWEFIVVKDKETRRKLAKLRSSGRFIREAPATIVVLGKESESNLWLQDCSLAASHIYLETVNQGLGTCWVNAVGSKTDDGGDAEKAFKEVLDVPVEVRILGLFPIGYPAEEKENYDEGHYDEAIVHSENYSTK